MVLAVLLSIVVSGTAVLMISVNRSSREARRVVTMDREIDSQLAEIKQLSGRLTCCSSVCSVTPPAAFGPNQNCATNDTLDPRYFYPQRDDPATITDDERSLVDNLCASGLFLNPLVTAVNSLDPPAGVTRTAAAQDNRTIRIVYTDIVNSRVTRVANITPPMARWCP